MIENTHIDLEKHPWLAPKQMALAQKVLANQEQRSKTLWAGIVRKVEPKTVCKRGHRLSGRNLRVYRHKGTVSRKCLKCEDFRRELARLEVGARRAKAAALLAEYGIQENWAGKKVAARDAAIQEVA